MPPVRRGTMAWGVVRPLPYQFAGLYRRKAEAEEKAGELGPEYEVHLGIQRTGTQEFIWRD
jgi:hypothetical protein